MLKDINYDKIKTINETICFAKLKCQNEPKGDCIMKDKKRCIVFIIDKLGYHCGGCTTVNYELCTAFRQITDELTTVVALVINSSFQDRVEILEKRLLDIGVRIKHQSVYPQKSRLSDEECNEICEYINSITEDTTEIVWVGHDIFTGHYAIQLAKYNKGVSAICIHTDYDTVEGLKGENREGILKENRQRKIIQQGNIIFAVGPRLMERVKEVRIEGIYELIPGLFYTENTDVYNERAVISYGRFEGNVAQVKQTQLVFAAFGRAVKLMNNNKDYVLHIIGCPNSGENKRLRDLAEKYAGRKLSINFLEYTQDRQLLFESIKNNCVGLMTSISEGFGLTGWEMISVGLPLIFTKKSGLYDFLDSEFGYLLNGMCMPVDLKGSSLDNICEEDVQIVAEKIVAALTKPQKLRKAAEELRKRVKNNTWFNTACNMAKGLGYEPHEYKIVEIYSETYKARKDSIDTILNRLELDEIEGKQVIFFGGVSSSLCQQRAIDKLSRWLEKDFTRNIFFCYEAGHAASERAKELDKSKLIEGELSNIPEKRMKEKEKMVEESVKKYAKAVRNQVHLIKLENSPLTYVIIADTEIYFTVPLPKRSSESMAMKLRDNANEERCSIIESMEFVLKKQESTDEINELINILNSIK